MLIRTPASILLVLYSKEHGRPHVDEAQDESAPSGRMVRFGASHRTQRRSLIKLSDFEPIRPKELMNSCEVSVVSRRSGFD
jgi:hypothetical protein